MVGYMVMVFCAVFLVTLFFLNLYRSITDPSVKWLRNLGKTKKKQEQESIAKKKTPAGEWIDKLFIRHGKADIAESKFGVRYQNNLTQAGFDGKKSVQTYIVVKIGLALLFMLIYGALAFVTGKTLQQVALTGLAMAAVGFLLPDVVLNFKIRKRQHLIAISLPDALDLLVITVEAGLGLNAALMRVGQDIRLRCVPLSEELLMVNQDMRTGLSREKALRRLADRNKIESLRILVGALVLADRLGSSIADTLRTQADSLRTRVRQRAEEQAAKAGVKMLIPLVLFILPALFIILMGPAVISVFKVFPEMGR